MKNLKIKVFGEVQGKGFRFEARQMADLLGLKGFIRNEPKGSVYAEAEGSEADLKKFLEWCRVGPRAAKVERVDSDFNEDVKGYRDFLVE